ncbi:MAG: hypothetical protein ACTJLK_01100 [Anaplasma sp.]
MCAVPKIFCNVQYTKRVNVLREREAAYSAEELSRRFALFLPPKGLIRRGNVIRGVAPVSEMLSKMQMAGPAASYGSEVPALDWDGELLSRVFFLFDTKPQDVRVALKSLLSVGLVPRVVCSEPEGLLLTKYWGVDPMSIVFLRRSPVFVSRDSVVLIYSAEASHMNFEVLRSYLSTPYATKNMCGILSRLTTGARLPEEGHNETGAQAADGRFLIARYDPSLKPLKQKIIDSVFYMEKWELLSEQEKTIRCVSSVLLTLVLPIMPLAFWATSRGRNNSASYDLGVLRWQASLYKKRYLQRFSPSSMMFGNDEALKQDFIRIAKSVGSIPELKYSDAGGEFTSGAQKESLEHKVLLLSGSNHKTKKLVVCMAVLIPIFSASFAHILLPASEGALAASIMYSFMLVVCVRLAVLAYRHKYKKGVMALTCLALLMVPLLAVAAVGYHSGVVSPALRGIDSCLAVIAVIATVLYTLAIGIAHLVHSRNKKIADGLGIGITAYLNMKPALISELKAHGRRTADAEVLLQVLSNSGQAGDGGQAGVVPIVAAAGTTPGPSGSSDHTPQQEGLSPFEGNGADQEEGAPLLGGNGHQLIYERVRGQQAAGAQLSQG